MPFVFCFVRGIFRTCESLMLETAGLGFTRVHGVCGNTRSARKSAGVMVLRWDDMQIALTRGPDRGFAWRL